MKCLLVGQSVGLNLCLLVHYQESLRIGYATRAIRCTGAVTWHIRENTLSWSDNSGNTSIRRLRTHSNEPISLSETQLELHAIDADVPFVKSVQYVYGDDLILELSSKPCQTSHGAPNGSEKMMRISREKVILWKVNSEICITKPAIGKNALYFMKIVPASESSLTERKTLITKINLEDGSILIDFPAPAVPSSQAWDTRWWLSSHEKFIIWRHSTTSIRVFSTSTGHLIDQYTIDSRNDIFMSAFNDQYWHVNLQKCYNSNCTQEPLNPCYSCSALVKYEGDAISRKSKRIDICIPTWVEYGTSARVFDGDNTTLFIVDHIVHPTSALSWRFLGQQEPTDPLSSIWAEGLEMVPYAGRDDSHIEYQKKWPRSKITLPGLSKKGMGRRMCEFDLPWRMKDGDFFGVQNHYLVYHSAEDETLLVVDFWPRW